MAVPYAFAPDINVLALVFPERICVLIGYFRAGGMVMIEALRHE
jgi:hypothetical protein